MRWNLSWIQAALAAGQNREVRHYRERAIELDGASQLKLAGWRRLVSRRTETRSRSLRRLVFPVIASAEPEEAHEVVKCRGVRWNIGTALRWYRIRHVVTTAARNWCQAPVLLDELQDRNMIGVLMSDSSAL